MCRSIRVITLITQSIGGMNLMENWKGGKRRRVGGQGMGGGREVEEEWVE